MALTNAQYDQIMRSYQQQQLEDARIVADRREELYRKVPVLEDLDSQISDCSLKAARDTLNGDQDALKVLHNRIHELHNMRLKSMKAAGFPEDYLTPPYKCPDCQDTGYINGRRCHCFTQKAIDLLYTQSNLADRLEQENFSTFRLDYYSKDNIDPDSGQSSYDIAVRALHKCRHFADAFQSEGGNLLLLGTPGIGKTFLSNCIAKAVMDQGCSVIYFTSFQLIDIFEKSTFGKDDEAKQDYDNIFSCDLLIIDDLGTEVNNSFTNSKLFECINERLLRNKSTVISTNLTPGQLSDIYSERIYSRLINSYQFIGLYGDNIRFRKAQSSAFRDK